MGDAGKAKPRYYDFENMTSDRSPVHPARMVADARKIMPRETIALVDSGAHRAFAAHYWDSYGPRQFLTAATLGPMGWAIGAGLGAKAARPDAPVLVFTGDGCMRMHGLEVQSASRAGLPVIYLVSNNQALGNVWLRARKEGEIPARLTEAPDQDCNDEWPHNAIAFARALGADGATVRTPGRASAGARTGIGLEQDCRHRREDGTGSADADRALCGGSGALVVPHVTGRQRDGEPARPDSNADR